MIPTIIISAIILVIVVAVIAKRVIDRKNGKASCGCGCSDCAAAPMCHTNKDK